MRRGHRWAHLGLVLVCGALAVGLFGYGWTTRAGRPSPQPIAAPEPPPGAAWEATIHTAVGAATVRYYEAGPTSDGEASDGEADDGEADVPFLWTTLPAELDAAEPGLILEFGDAPPRTLGSIAPGRPMVPLPGGLGPGGLGSGDFGSGDFGSGGPASSDLASGGSASGGLGGGGELVLVDLARGLQLGRAELPEGAR